MDEKISLKAVEQYSGEFASKIAAGFFAGNEKITGPEILELCDIPQVNLFVICELLHSWKSESDKLKSPFFNYQAPEVIEALKTFQNTLSNHIAIGQSEFLPLLKKATTQTLSVLLAPYDYFSDALDGMGSGFIPVATLKSDLKYLKINRAPFEKLLQKLEEKKLTLVPRNEAFALLDAILEEVSFTPEDMDRYLPKFSAVVALSVDQFYDSASPQAPTLSHESVAPPVKVPEHPAPAKPVVVAPKAQPAVNKPFDRSAKAAGHLQKIARIKDSLTINQKFMFTKILFHGDFEIFSQAVDRIDTLDNLTQAENYLGENWPEWDKEGTEYLEFRDMLERRFS